MELQSEIIDFIEQPVVLWENQLTQLLVDKKTRELEIPCSFNNNYRLTNYISKDNSEIEIKRPLFNDQESFQLVKPNNIIASFLQEHGLSALPLDETNFAIIVNKVKSALGIFRNIPLAQTFITQIVKSLVLVYSENEETDISYSHPDIPFSIFFSLCENQSSCSGIRVAESILHEAMHLKLTLIERIVPLVKPNSAEVYFSPWRDENRPVRGVLHGLFVFRAILDFYCQLKSELTSIVDQQFVNRRIKKINQELETLYQFSQSPGLTPFGGRLVERLIADPISYATGSSGNLHLTQ